jgi:hypothetical protein
LDALDVRAALHPVVGFAYRPDQGRVRLLDALDVRAALHPVVGFVITPP